MLQVANVTRRDQSFMHIIIPAATERLLHLFRSYMLVWTLHRFPSAMVAPISIFEASVCVWLRHLKLFITIHITVNNFVESRLTTK